MMKTMIANSKDNDSDSDSVDTWRANLSDAEQMHVLAAAGISPDDEQIEFDDDDLKKYIGNKLRNGRSRIKINENVNEVR